MKFGFVDEHNLRIVMSSIMRRRNGLMDASVIRMLREVRLNTLILGQHAPIPLLRRQLLRVLQCLQRSTAQTV